MIYILLSILSATGIFLVFKLIDKKHLPTFSVITINYLVAYLAGFLLLPKCPMNAVTESWFNMAFIIGFVFIVFFFVIGISSKHAGMSITSVASKMSVVIPIAFSIVYYQESLNTYKIIGMSLALAGLFMTVYTNDKGNTKEKKGLKRILLPIVLFIGMGCIDSLVKYTQESKSITQDINAYFTSILFLIAFLFGLLYILSSKKLRFTLKNPRVYLYGLVLGLVNYGSIYFLISALNSEVLDSSVIFGVNNVGVVVLSVLLGVFAFKEKIIRLNFWGICCSVAAIFILSFS